MNDQLPGRRYLGVAALLVISAALYLPALDRVPAHLHYDEIYFGLHAHALAETGRDANGRLLPVYLQSSEGSNYWLQPLAPYLIALFLQVLPLSDTAIRLPTVFIGLLTILLTYAVARRIFLHEGYALVAAAILALTPAHLIHSRLAMDYIYPLPFILGWLLCLLVWLERRESWLLFAATSLLGLGFYSYVASVVMMPVYFATTLAVVVVARSSGRAVAAATAGFCWPLLAAAAFLLSHPQLLADFQSRYGLGAADVPGLTLAGRVTQVVNPRTIAERLNLFHDFFSPGFLFISGGSNITNSTREAGVFLLASAIFLVAGVYDAVTRPTRQKSLVVIGFLTSPLAALLVVENYAIDRALALLPFGALLVSLGLARLWPADCRMRLKPLAVSGGVLLIAAGLGYTVLKVMRQGDVSLPSIGLVAAGFAVIAIGALTDWSGKAWPIVIGLVLTGLFQYQHFYRDYFGDYAARSAAWFGNDMRGAIERVVALATVRQAPAIYLSEGIRNVTGYWRFYLAADGRADLLPKGVAVNFQRMELAPLPPGSLLVCLAAEAEELGLDRRSELTRVGVASDPNPASSPLGPGKHVTYVIYRRVGD